MASYYHFRWSKEDQGEALIVVATAPTFAQQELQELVERGIFDGRPYPDRVIIIVPQDGADNFQQSLSRLVNSGAVLRLRSPSVPVLVVPVDAQGRYDPKQLRLIQGRSKLTKADFGKIIGSGIANLARSRQAVLLSPPGHHFVHPRKRHSRGFLRAANMLIQGNEIGLLAFAILPYLDDNIEKVWIDSSSIASLVYAAYSLKSRLARKHFSPLIESFSSYEGLANLDIKNLERELVLISATATGSLPEEVARRTGLAKQRVVTLFSMARVAPGVVLFDARGTVAGADVMSMEVFEETNCPWCQNGSRTITFVGDQFLADAVTFAPYTILESDAPKALRDVMKKYRGKSAFSLRLEPGGNAHRLHVDLEPTLLGEDYRAAIRTVVQRSVPASTSHIFAIKGKDSWSFAQTIATEIVKIGLTAPEVLDARNVKSTTRRRQGVIVVAGSIGSGQSFQEASRDLRDPFKNLPRTFIAGLRKHGAAEHHVTLVKDLEHNNNNPKHVICAVDEMTLPHPNQFGAWASERRFWQKIAEDYRRTSSARPIAAFAEQRIATLAGEITGNDFFLPADKNVALVLRAGFAFWDKDYDETTTHGDVFSTISAILEQCRKVVKGPRLSAALSHSPFHVNILSAENFTRFNDGIIQAALLRAAFPQCAQHGRCLVGVSPMAS